MRDTPRHVPGVAGRGRASLYWPMCYAGCMRRMTQARRELRALLDEVLEIDWRRPSWWVLLMVMAWLDTLGRWREAARSLAKRVVTRDHDDTATDELAGEYSEYLAANGGPASDTFMGRDRKPARSDSGESRAEPWQEDAAVLVARAVVRARAAVEVIQRFDDVFPQQPLVRVLAWEHGMLTRRALADAGKRKRNTLPVAFVTPRGSVIATIDDVTMLARALADYIAGGETQGLEEIDASANVPTQAVVAVALSSDTLGAACHAHRRAWTAAGGPWLGIIDSGGMELVTTCHLAIDGFAHARLTSEIFVRVDACSHAEFAALVLAAKRTSLPVPAADSQLERVGFASCTLPASLRFVPMAYAFGRTLAVVFGQASSFQIPVAPAGRDDTRRRRRVLHGVFALKHEGTQFESYAAFAARMPALLERERHGDGPLTRMMRAILRAPIPRFARRWLLAKPRLLTPPAIALHGRGGLSSLRFPAGEAPRMPLYAASMPALPDGVMLTLVHHEHGVTASLCSTGRLGTPAAAKMFLSLWRDRLDALGFPTHDDARPAYRIAT